MSSTVSGKPFLLRLDQQDRTDLTRCVMKEILRVQTGGDDEPDPALVRRLRAMLDRLSD